MRTAAKIKFLKSQFPDFEIIEIWSHDWHKLCKKVKLTFETPKETLNPRHALYGG